MILNKLLLDYIVLFHRKWKLLSAESWYRDSLFHKQYPYEPRRFDDALGKLEKWFADTPAEELHIVGLKKNLATFEWLYHSFVLHDIPQAWLEEPSATLHKFEVKVPGGEDDV